MTTIRVNCPICSDVDLPATAITLLIRLGADSGIYRFCCPNCGEVITRDADAKAAALLVSAGVEVLDPDEELATLPPPGSPARCAFCSGRLELHCTRCDWIVCTSPGCHSIYSPRMDRWSERKGREGTPA